MTIRERLRLVIWAAATVGSVCWFAAGRVRSLGLRDAEWRPLAVVPVLWLLPPAGCAWLGICWMRLERSRTVGCPWRTDWLAYHQSQPRPCTHRLHSSRLESQDALCSLQLCSQWACAWDSVRLSRGAERMWLRMRFVLRAYKTTSGEWSERGMSGSQVIASAVDLELLGIKGLLRGRS